jgi:hypothetical protein
MHFRRVKQLMRLSCRSYRRQLSPYLDGELAQTPAERLESHLSECVACREELELQRFAVHMIGNLPAPAVPDAPRWRVPDLAPQQEHIRFKPVLLSVAAVVSVAAVAALGLWYFQRQSAPAWEVERLDGRPVIAARSINGTGNWRAGERLETDGSSRALVRIGRIGYVEVDSDSRLRLIKTGGDQYRLALDRGRLLAGIIAPARLFQIETPSAVAIDLGCAYALEVNEAGASLLRVTSGWVALARNGEESFVPAGALCRAEANGRLGTPYFEDAAPEFVQALERFDSAADVGDSLTVVLDEARARDGLTLWQMLARVSDRQRERIYDRLITLIPAAAGIGKAETLRLDAAALAQWKEESEFAALGVDPRVVPRAAGALKPVGPMLSAREGHTATLLPNGKVLLAGGSSGEAVLAEAELYDPATGGFSQTGAMTSPRFAHEATLLSDGRVLITGGLGRNDEALSDAEIYDPATQRFSRTGVMQIARSSHRAQLLIDGRVLITGGLSPDWPRQRTAEIYDPATGRFSSVGDLSFPRADHTSTLLPDGRVLICAGSTGRSINQDVTDTAELFDPASNRFTNAGRLVLPRHKHAAVRLRDGRVLVIGGADSRLSGFYNSAEIYDPAANRFTPTGRMSTARYKIREAAALLADGRVLLAGGGERLEIYDPQTGVFSLLPDRLTGALRYSTTTLLGDRTALIAGGYDDRGQSNSGAWIYSPGAGR